MENIALHIEYLLLKQDCVTVPGFGAFIVINEKPIFNFESGMIAPMMREVRFNSALRADDGLLASSYARKYGLTYREASDLLGRDIASLLYLLENEREVAIGSLGVIRKSEEGNMFFQPFRTASKLAMDLGFLAVPFTKAKSFLIEENSENPEESSNEAAQESPKGKNRATRKKKFDLERNYYIPVNKVFAKSVAAILCAITICITVLFPATNRENTEDRASVVPVDRIIETVVHSTPDKVENLTKKEIIKEDSIHDLHLPNYYLIVGTFRTEAEAEKYISMYSESQYDLEILSTGKVSRVSAKKSCDRTTLQDLMNDKIFREVFRESWIWQKAE